MLTPRVAEVAAENWLRYSKAGGLAPHTFRTRRTKFGKQDMFASDVVGKSSEFTTYIQVTTSQGKRKAERVRERKRALEEITWVDTDRVLLFTVEEQQDQNNKRAKLFYFRVLEYDLEYPFGKPRVWKSWGDLVPIRKEWLKPIRESYNQSELAAGQA